jgi:TrmH RNA methyltransferase
MTHSKRARGVPPAGGPSHTRSVGTRPAHGAGANPVAPARMPPARPAAQDPTELTVGLRAGLALFAARPDDVLRIAYTRAVRGEIGDLVRTAAAQHLPCDEMSEAEIERFAESNQNEGLCIAARPRKWASMQDLAEQLVRARGVAIALDRVRNPYNVGAIVRSAAFFGIDALLLGAPAPHPGLAPTAVRVAEGGADLLRLARTTDLADTLARLAGRGIQVVGADMRGPLDARSYAFARPVVIVLGNEREGLDSRVRAQCGAFVSIRGTGRLESLNVAVAAGVLFAAATRPT